MLFVLIGTTSTDDIMEVDGDTTQYASKKSAFYSVEAIVKKKLIFKTRPKPIIANVPKKI